MTWAFLDDHADEHPKLLAVGAEAAWYWACGLCYCRRNPRVPGFIPEQKAQVLYPVKNVRKIIASLVASRLWHEVPGGYEVHKYGDVYGAQSPEALPEADAEALRSKRAEAGRLGGLRSSEARRSKFGSAQPRSKPEAKAPEAPARTRDARPAGGCAPGSARVAGAPGSDSDSGSDLLDIVAASPDLLGEAKQRRRPSNLSEALAIPIRERAELLERDPLLADLVQAQLWPEVQAIASALGAPKLGAYGRDSGVRAVVELYAAGFEQTELETAANALPSHDWWRRERRGLSSLSPEVVRRALATHDERPSGPRLLTPAEEAEIESQYEAGRR